MSVWFEMFIFCLRFDKDITCFTVVFHLISFFCCWMNNSCFLRTSDLNADLIMRQNKLNKKAKFRKIKSTNPKLKHFETVKEQAEPISTLQRLRTEINKHSPYGILQSSNTREQKTSNHTEMTSNDIKTTSKDLKVTTNEPNKNRRNKLKGGDPSIIHISGKDLIKQAFSFK